MNDTVRLTASYINRLMPSSTRYYVRDSKQEYLSLVVQVTGRKSWYIVRKIDGKVHRVKLGDFPKMKPADARGAAVSVLARLQKAAPETVKVVDPSTFSLADLWPKFKKDHIEAEGLRDAAGLEGLWRCHIVGESNPNPGTPLSARPMATITAPDVEEWVKAIRKYSGPSAANHSKGLLSSMWNMGIRWGKTTTANPASFVPKIKIDKRTRHLDQHELVRFLLAVRASDSDYAADAAMLLLLTAARKSNVLSMAWTEIDFGLATWTIPKEKFKTGKVHAVPLVGEAVAILDRRHSTCGSPVWVFPTLWGRMEWRRNLHTGGWNDIVKAANLDNFTPHDLRRTAATWANLAGVTEEHTAHWLGHERTNITGGAYAQPVLQKTREAAEKATRLMLSVLDDNADVLEFSKRG